MNCDKSLAFFYAVANALVKFEADGMVDGCAPQKLRMTQKNADVAIKT